jgi:hypothetical protein
VRRYVRLINEHELIATSHYSELKLEELINAKKFDVSPAAGPDMDRLFVNRAVASITKETELGIGDRKTKFKASHFRDNDMTAAFDLMANTPKKPDSYQQLEKKDGVFLLWTYYRDGYGIGRSGSNIGTYMGLGNFSPAFRNFSESISTLNHHPQGFNSFDSTAGVREDSLRLRNGVKMYKVSEGKFVDVEGVLAIAKTDSQELLKYLNHGSFQNHGCCPHCQVCVCHYDSIDYSSTHSNIHDMCTCAGHIE